MDKNTNLLNLPVNKEAQLNKIIEDTEEIIRNFKMISELIIEDFTQKNDQMYNLGKKLINSKENNKNSTQILGNTKISSIY